MPHSFSNAYTSGTECRIDLKPGCKFELVRCLKVYKKNSPNHEQLYSLCIGVSAQTSDETTVQNIPEELEVACISAFSHMAKQISKEVSAHATDETTVDS